MDKNSLSRYLSTVENIKISDIFSFVPMIVCFLLRPLYKSKYEKTWLICERPNEAQDNGYHFFRYMCDNHPEQSFFYAIKKKANDYDKIKKYNRIIEYGSIKHWMIYFSAEYLISSQSGRPNQYSTLILERLHIFNPKFIFLQHGVTKDCADFLKPHKLLASKFITATPQEYKFLIEEMDYKKENVEYCGFSRFDFLHKHKENDGQILIMPTWRKWIVDEIIDNNGINEKFLESEYWNGWKQLFYSHELRQIIEKYRLKIILVLHPNMRKYDIKSEVPSFIKILSNPDNLQDLLMTSNLLITDYSSVFFDMAYMRKPIIFYQFDEEKYRSFHYKQGWFDYHATHLGESLKTCISVVKKLDEYCANGFSVSDLFNEEHKKLFPKYDDKNSFRIYSVLKRSE